MSSAIFRKILVVIPASVASATAGLGFDYLVGYYYAFFQKFSVVTWSLEIVSSI